MPNQHYKVGYTLERDVKIALEQEGYTVFRSAGSHSQADLIAFKPFSYMIEGPAPTLIQCKRHRNLMTNNEINAFNSFAQHIGCRAVVAWRDKGIHLEEIKKK